MNEVPRPDPSWGAWRREPVTIVGRRVTAHTFSSNDRTAIVDRMSNTHEDKANDNDKHCN